MILTEDQSKTVTCIEQMLPIRDALDVIGGKWKVLILSSIMQGNRRFSAIKTSIPHISAKVLASELKAMEDHQLIERIVDADSPAFVAYVATDYSRSLKKVMLELHDWGVNHRKQIIGK